MPTLADAISQNPLNPSHAATQWLSQQPPMSANPQLDKILESIRNTPGASGSVGGQDFTGGPLPQTGGQQANPFASIIGDNPWASNPTSPTTNPDGSPGAPYNMGNNTFINQDAATRLANIFGANLVQDRLHGGTGRSVPNFSLDFGAGDPQDANQIMRDMQRGDNPADILARIRDGLAPPLARHGAALGDSRTGLHDLYTADNPTVRNLQPGQVSGMVPGVPGSLGSSRPGGPFGGVQASTHLGRLSPPSIPERLLSGITPPGGPRIPGTSSAAGGSFGNSGGTGIRGPGPGTPGDLRGGNFQGGNIGGPGFTGSSSSGPGSGGEFNLQQLLSYFLGQAPSFGQGGGFGGGFGQPGFGQGFGQGPQQQGFGQPGGASSILDLIQSMGNLRNQAGSTFMRRPQLPSSGGGRGGGFLNSWYYPRSEPNLRGLSQFGSPGRGFQIPGQMGQSFY